MNKIKIIKKNDEYSMEYEVGDIFEPTGTWYGGVHISGKSGVPVSLEKEEYIELGTKNTEPELPLEEGTERDIYEGDNVPLITISLRTFLQWEFRSEIFMRGTLSVILRENGYHRRPQNIFTRCWLLQATQKPGSAW